LREKEREKKSSSRDTLKFPSVIESVRGKRELEGKQEREREPKLER